ncbi:MAG: HD family phosphohydrolase [Myxococcaceae bacterium]
MTWRRLGLLGLAGWVSLAASFVVSPGLARQQIPPLSVLDVGKPYVAPGGSAVRASRDYQVYDESATAQRREEARSRVLPVFDFQPLVHEEAIRRVRETVARKRVDAPVEDALVARLERVHAKPIVRSREELRELAPEGLVVRNVRVPSAVEPRVPRPDSPDVQDVEDARRALVALAVGEFPAALTQAVASIAQNGIRPNLTVNIAETEARRVAAAAAVEPVYLYVRKGERVLADGDVVTAQHLRILSGIRAQAGVWDRLRLQLGGMGLVAVLILVAFLSIHSRRSPTRLSLKDALFLSVVLLTSLFGVHAATDLAQAAHEAFPRAALDVLKMSVPVVAAALLVARFLRASHALFFTWVFAPLVGVLSGNSLVVALLAWAGSSVGVRALANGTQVGGLFRAGFWATLAQLAVLVSADLATGRSLSGELFARAAGLTVATLLLAPSLVWVMTPFVERLFGYASASRLRALSSLNHPALKELIVQAPGTYHHSILLGGLVEAAAEAIGANPLLARTCAYYHDIGKVRDPLYFGENQKTDNQHDALSPARSAYIIKKHVTDGLEVARRYRLPRAVCEVIAQHHGTRRVGVFHHKAVREAEGRGGREAVLEAEFRYAGPPPTFVESALVMLGDAVEAATRSLQNPTPGDIDTLVPQVIQSIGAEGQLDDTDLTFAELEKVKLAFVRALRAAVREDSPVPGAKPLALPSRPSQNSGSA